MSTLSSSHSSAAGAMTTSPETAASTPSASYLQDDRLPRGGAFDYTECLTMLGEEMTGIFPLDNGAILTLHRRGNSNFVSGYATGLPLPVAVSDPGSDQANSLIPSVVSQFKAFDVQPGTVKGDFFVHTHDGTSAYHYKANNVAGVQFAPPLFQYHQKSFPTEARSTYEAWAGVPPAA